MAQDAATPARTRRRAPEWLTYGLVGAVIWIGFQQFPKFHPVFLLHTQADYTRILSKLSGTDQQPVRAGESGTQFGDELSDKALFAEWLAEPDRLGGSPLTVGGVIDLERRRVEGQIDRSLEKARLLEQQRAAHEAQVAADEQAEAQQARAIDAANKEQSRVAQAKADAAKAAQDKTVACNTARSHAYGVARSPADFVAWIRAHPCAEGTDIGDGYWNVAH